jgi:uncharacterized membrane protein
MKIFNIFRIFLFSLLIIFILGVLLSEWHGYFGLWNPLGRDYRIPSSTVNIELNSQGQAYITEQIDYMFKGCYYELYRSISPDIKRSPDSLYPYIKTISARCNPDCTINDRRYEVAGSYRRICDTTASFFLNYTIENSIYLGNDADEFHYKIRGDQWDRPAQRFSGIITLPPALNKDNTKLYFNPAATARYDFRGNTIVYDATNVNSYLEVLILAPKNVFVHGIVKNIYKSSEINDEENYILGFYIIRIVYYAVLVILFFLIIIIPVHIFEKYGKEPKIGYRGIFEREPVACWKPFAVNALLSTQTGSVDDNALNATILDLVRRGHIQLQETKEKKFLHTSDNVIMTFQLNPRDNLSECETLLYEYLKSKGNPLDWNKFKKSLSSQVNASEFIIMVTKFKLFAMREANIEKYFENAGSTLFRRSCIGSIVAGALLIFFISNSKTSNYPFFTGYFIFAIVFAVLGIAGLFIPYRVFGKFTPEGYEIYKKSLNFKKFLGDHTLLSRYPPASVIIWDEQLVYATAFGVAAVVIKEMQAHAEIARNSTLYPIYNAHIYSSFSGTYAHAQSSMSSGGGGGGAGGGFGGGGGGGAR